ncbi:MAG: acyl-CoA dehydratase activase [Clostridiales bacterium]|nr:acyl-CoA dehydratase activase [Clostridiales bacterium]
MLTLGIDIGSTTSKCVLLRDGSEVVGSSLIGAGIGTEGAQSAYAAVLEQAGVLESEIAFQTATGYGRTRWRQADAEISELTAHALGCYFLQPDVRTVVDIGGQDAKVLSLDESGLMKNFIMNDKCAAGTGRFLDVMANILHLRVEELGEMALCSATPATISSTCTVFAESEVISQLANGADRADVVAGICSSVAVRVAALAKRAGVRERVCMTGGVAQNIGVRRALSSALDIEVYEAEMPQLNGALGAALAAWKKASH